MRARPIPQYAVEPVGVMIYSLGQLTDPDNNQVFLQVVNTDTNTVIVASGTQATKESTGQYQYTFNSDQTSIMGNYVVNWYYSINSSPRQYDDPFVITDQMPYFQNLTYDQRQIAIGIFHRLDKSFDSTAGGPYLQELQ
jgi:hypothetical protein